MKEKVYVWDPLVRTFHWLLLALFIISYLTGEEESDYHVYSGYCIAGLLVARVIWGWIGSKHARFTDFVSSPLVAWRDFRSLIKGTPERHLGHNPAGGLMIVALLISVTMIVLSGVTLYGYEGEGPLAFLGSTMNAGSVTAQQTKAEQLEHDDGDEFEETTYAGGRVDSKHEEREHEKRKHGGDEHEDGEEFWEEVHEFFVNFTLLLIVLHLTGVILTSRLLRENLVRAMISGYKEVR